MMAREIIFNRLITISAVVIALGMMVNSPSAQNTTAPKYTVHTLPLPDDGTGDVSMGYIAFDATTNWSSQDLVDKPSPGLMGHFELLGAQAAEMTVPPVPIAKGVNVVSHVGLRQFSILVDLFLDSFLFQTAEERLGDGIAQQLALRLMLGSK